VETAEQRDQLAALGSDLCQVYYFARLMIAVRLAEALGREDAAG
jgi:EAL domain-containing protein (putative c-di-GMP-specific phosphodiesterase class I)